jgi:hypothetical protein
MMDERPFNELLVSPFFLVGGVNQSGLTSYGRATWTAPFLSYEIDAMKSMKI